MSSRSRPGSGLRREGGFTLLEVLCAFAILVATAGLLTRTFVQNVDQGTDALARRELREAADTIFRKIIYEHPEYDDGDTRTLDEEYGEFARLKGWARDRWAIYTMVLEKKAQTVAGYDPSGEDPLFGEVNTGNRSTGTGTSTDTGTGSATTPPADGEAAGFRLTRLTLKIYRTDDYEQEPLFTLSTWIDPGKNEGGVR